MKKEQTINDIQKDFGTRLRQRREELGLKKQDLAASIDVSLTTIQQYENGQMPRGEFAVRLAQVLACSLDWLLAGQKQNTICQNRDNFFCMPILKTNLVQCDLHKEVLCKSNFAFQENFLHQKGDINQMLLMRVSGDSMQPNILNNDMVLIDKSQTNPIPGQIFAIEIEHMIYLKFVNALPGKLLFSCYNPNYSTVEVDIKNQNYNDLRIIGRAIWICREL